MTHWKKKGLSILLAAVLVLGLSVNAFAAVSDDALANAVTDTAQYMYQTVQSPATYSSPLHNIMKPMARTIPS